jgi:hypothetical protein
MRRNKNDGWEKVRTPRIIDGNREREKETKKERNYEKKLSKNEIRRNRNEGWEKVRTP